MHSLRLVGLLGSTDMEERVNQEYEGFFQASMETHNRGFELVFEHCEIDTPYAWHARFYSKHTEAVLVVYYPGIKTVFQVSFEDRESAEKALGRLNQYQRAKENEQ